MEIENLKAEAEGGNIVSVGVLGLCYLYGYNVDVDYQKAFYWLSKAALKGASRPTAGLAHMYVDGLGMPRDLPEGIRLYEKAALRDEFIAQIALGRIFNSGISIPRDPIAAFRWYTLAFSKQPKIRENDDIKETEQYLVNTPGYGDLLVELLENDPSDLVRSAAATVLGIFALPSTIPSLIATAGSSSSSIRPYILRALGNVGNWDIQGTENKSAIEHVLVSNMDDASATIRELVASAIHEKGHDTPKTRTKLLQALDDSDLNVRGEAAYGLAKFGEQALTLRLGALLQNDSSVSIKYFAAANRLGNPSLLPAVMAAADRLRAAFTLDEQSETEINRVVEYLSSISKSAGNPQ